MADEISYTRKERKRYWKEPGTQKWANHLKQKYPNHQWQAAGSDKLTGRCLFHQDSSPSAYIDLERGFYKCVGCGKFHTDPIRMEAEASKIDYTTAFKQLVIVDFGLKVPKRKEKELEVFDGYQEMMRMVAKVASNLLVKAAANPGDDSLSFTHNAISYLRKRGIRIKDAANMGVGVFPRFRDIHNFHAQDPKKYQRPYALFRDYFVRKGIVPEGLHLPGKYGGDHLTFPHYTSPDVIGRLKLRNTSASNSYSVWIGPGTEQGFFGLNAYPTLIGNTNQLSISEKVFIVEGEFDQLSMYQAMEKLGGVDTIVISGSGAGVSGVDDLPYFGFKNIIAIGDNDSGGRKFVQRVFSEVSPHSHAAHYAFDYPSEFAYGDDPDAIVQRGDFQKFHDLLHSKDNWKESYEWSAQQVEELCHNDPNMDLGSKLRLVREYGDLVPEGHIRGEYISKIANKLGLSELKLRQDMASSDTESGFILAIKRELGELFEPLVVESNFSVLCHSKVNNMLFSLPTKRQRDMVLRLQNFCFETDAYNWISHTLGIPDFVTEDPNSKKGHLRMVRHQHRDIEEYVYRATDSYVSERAKPIDQYEVRRQGVHFFDADNDPVDIRELPKECAEQRLVIVNGLDTYLGELKRDDNGDLLDSVIYKKMRMPVHSKYLFETSDRQFWADSIKSEEDLNTPITFDEFKAAFDDAQKVVDVFPWEHPEIQRTYAPCFMAMLPLSMMTENFPLDANQGPTQSGKSTWIKQVLRNDDGYGLVEHATGYDDYTAAGLAQAAGGSSLLMCVDEFEDADDATAGKRSSVVQNTLEMFRNVAEGARQTRGTQSGENREEYMRFPISIACIQPFKREEDLNRWVINKMTPNRDARDTPPAVKLRQLFTRKRFAEIRRILTLYPLQNAGLFYSLQKEVSHEVFEEKKVVCKEYRFLHSIVMLLAIAKHLGLDYIKYAKDHVSLHEENLELSVLSEEKRLFRAVFQTKAVRFQQDGSVPHTVLETLNDADLAMKLSGANCGVYHLPSRDYVVIDPYGVATNILQHSPVYRNITNTHSVFQRLIRHPEVHHKPQMLLNDLEMMNLLYVYVSRTPVEEFLVVYLSDLRKNGEAINGPIGI